MEKFYLARRIEDPSAFKLIIGLALAALMALWRMVIHAMKRDKTSGYNAIEPVFVRIEPVITHFIPVYQKMTREVHRPTNSPITLIRA